MPPWTLGPTDPRIPGLLEESPRGRFVLRTFVSRALLKASNLLDLE